jgi:N-acetylglutamate synthase-like GNAT family acetyltransferase
MNHPEPELFFGDLDYFRSRVGARNTAAIVAESDDGRLLGSNLMTRWGSVAYFGPLSVRPDAWEGGVGKKLVAATLRQFDTWGVKLRGLYTFAQSPKHVGLYYKHGFHPRFLTPVMGNRVHPEANADDWKRFSEVPESGRDGLLEEVRAVTNAMYPGLDITDEMLTVAERDLGDTVLLEDAGSVAGVAVCHAGPGTEAGKDVCYIKFGGVAPTAGAAERFTHLLHAVEAYAASRELEFLLAGVNTAREEAYKILLERGFKTRMQGVVMHSPNVAGYSTPGSYVIDDWR